MNLPTKGFYYHYKHDPAGPLGNYTYEVIGVGRNTELETLVVLYRPLYINLWLKPAEYCSRPLEMFLEEVAKGDTTSPRFQKVTDENVIAELEALKNTMYP
ncbi:MAG: DUF1653 domain-containing protein [Candidatus Paceibacterota bacterium]